MSREKLKSIWSQLPAWGALVLAFGALPGRDAQANQSQAQPSPDSQLSERLTVRPNEVAVRLDGEIICVSQDGITFEELHLGNTPEAARLRKLLRDAGAVGRSVSVPIGSMIVASGGGSGKGEKPNPQTSKETDHSGKAK